VDNSIHNVIASIPGRNTVTTINKFTIIKASPNDFGLQDNMNIIKSRIPDFLTISLSPQKGAIRSHLIRSSSNSKIVEHFPRRLQTIPAVAIKAVSGISVKKSLEIDNRQTISAIMDEVKICEIIKWGTIFVKSI